MKSKNLFASVLSAALLLPCLLQAHPGHSAFDPSAGLPHPGHENEVASFLLFVGLTAALLGLRRLTSRR